MLELYEPYIKDLWFKEKMMGDEQTMAYNHAYGGTIPFPFIKLVITTADAWIVLNKIFHQNSSLSPVSPLYYNGIPLCRAVPWCRCCLKQDLSWRREQAPTLRCNHIITQIGRENNISAEILLLRTVEDACPYKCCVKLPYEKERIAVLFSLT